MMPAIPRQKACIACADSKRKCDKQLPECQRCLDRDADCIYPQPKRRRREPVAFNDQSEQFPNLPNYAGDNILEGSLGFGDWGAMRAADLDVSLSDVIIPYIPTPSAPVVSLSTPRVGYERCNMSKGPSPWFLRDETWVMRHCNQQPACMTVVELEPFIRIVREMLQSWVRKGYNSFIHRRLYDKGMPTCLQDAFITLAAYISRTPAVEDTILQIADERSCKLVLQSPPSAVDSQGILTHLAHVQALFIYMFIRLFDGSVRMRASAEQQLPTLRQWVFQMWEAVKQYRGEDIFSGHRPLQWTEIEFDQQFNASSKMWQLWILTESVRRSHIVIDFVANIYETMTKGWANCNGTVMFTTCHGLWEAESGLKWFELCCTKPPLLVPSLQPASLISQYAAEEFDDFAKTYWGFIVGADKIQCWINRSTKASRT